MDKEANEIMEEVLQSLAAARKDEWGHWARPIDEWAQLSQRGPDLFDSGSE